MREHRAEIVGTGMASPASAGLASRLHHTRCADAAS